MSAADTLEQFFLDRTVLAAAQAASDGYGPFAAVVVAKSGHVYWGVNNVTMNNDPTAHAEVTAIREAAQAEGFDLSGAVLFSSCEPCPMCLTAALWARVDEIVWAATSLQAAEAGFDDSEFYANIKEGLSEHRARRGSIETGRANTPFKAWARNGARVKY